MVKRKCGTCRHFKDGGIAGSGWCQHSARKDIQHMVLVRKTELACRNSWDQDLWELADRPMDIQPPTHIPMPLSGGDIDAAPVARADMSVEDLAQAGEMFTDRITSISMPTRSQLRPRLAEASASVDDASDVDLSGARSIVREARKRRQEQRTVDRRKIQEHELRRVDDLLESAETVESNQAPPSRTHVSEGPMTASHERRTERGRHQGVPPSVSSRTERPPRNDDVDTSIEFSAKSPTFQHRSPQSRPASTSEIPKTPRPSSERAKRSERVERVERNEHGEGGHRGERVNRDERRQPVERAANPHPANDGGETEPFSTNEVRVSAQKQRAQQASRTDVREEQAEVVHPVPPVVVRSSRVNRTRSTPMSTDERRPSRISNSEGRRAPIEPEPAPIDPIDVAGELQTVRRCCATCRDFKQVGDGRTGWCNNPYAFSEKRMVQSNEVACRSGLGIWWLPHDDLWLEHADTTHHGRPTPLLDEILGAVPAGRQEKA